MAGEERTRPSLTAGNRRDQERGRLVVHVLVATFGVTSWSIMNGLWLELPILVAHLPEGWTLPSDLTIIAQFGNLGPVLFSLLVYLFPKTKLEIPTSGLIVAVLSLCALFFSVLWKETAYIGENEISVALLSLTFIQAVFAATTSQAYLAFMSHLKVRYISSLFLGMSLSGLIPALVAVAQGQGDIRCLSNNETHGLVTRWNSNGTNESYVVIPTPGINGNKTNTTLGAYTTDLKPKEAQSLEPSFTVQHFFLLLFAMGMLSMLSLLLLLYHPVCKQEHVDVDAENDCRLMAVKEHLTEVEHGSSSNGTMRPDAKHSTSLEDMFENQRNHQLDKDDKDNNVSLQETKEADENEFDTGPAPLKRFEIWYLLFLLAWVNSLQTTFLLAIQVYSSLPYGISFYHGATKAENIVDPIACFITIFVTARTSRVISGLTILGTLLASYIITMAALSPEPLLVDHLAGGVLAITFWVCCTLVMVYTKVSIATIMRTQGRLALIWSGASTQAGAFVGAVLAYIMVNHLGFFHDTPWCDRDQ